MDKKTEIYVIINDKQYKLDLYDNFDISLNYNISDIQDISKKSGSFSRTIKIPATRNNNYIFNDLSNLFISTSIKINKKIKCVVYVNDISVINGYMHINKCIKNIYGDYDEYELVIYDDNVDLFTEMKKYKLTDIDFSELNHVWSHNNIVNSWTASWYNGYYYPLIDYGYDWDYSNVNGWDTKNMVKTYHLYPSTNVKYIIDKIFDFLDFTYKSDFFDSKYFKSLYIPFNKEEFYKKEGKKYYLFSVGLNEEMYFGNDTILNIQDPYYYDPNYGWLPQSIMETLYVLRIPYDNETSPYGDPNDFYSVTLFEYTAPPNAPACKFVVNFDITFKYREGHIYEYYKTGVNGIRVNYIVIKRSKNPYTGLDEPGGYIIPTEYTNEECRFVPEDIPNIKYFDNYRRVVGQISTILLGDLGAVGDSTGLFPGEKVWVEVKYSMENIYLIDENIITWNVSTGYFELPPTYDLIKLHKNNEFFIIVNDKYIPGEIIFYNDVIPENIHISDFFRSICNMFNLYIEPDKVYNRCFIIEPRDDFYKKGKIIDWTDKLSTDNEIEVDIIPDFAKKRYIFKYKNDEDILNKLYEENNDGKLYGEYIKEIDNEFLDGENKIELIFSPTPLTNIKNSDIIIPKIGKINDNYFSKTKHNIRILQRYNSSTEKIWHYDDYVFYNNPLDEYNGYVALTTDISYSPSFTNITHNFSVGDVIKIEQDDGGVTKPMLQFIFEIVKIVDDKTIVINIPWSEVGSGPTIGGFAKPLDGLLPIKNKFYWSFNNVKLTVYPYLGHFDNPYNPDDDLNFGVTNGLFYYNYKLTNNNLYNKYYDKYIEDITSNDSRIIKCKIKLNEKDINELSFRNIIFINNSYFYINKIIDYKANKNELTTVELLKCNNITHIKDNNIIPPPDE